MSNFQQKTRHLAAIRGMVLVLCVGVLMSTAHADVYKYVDKRGRTVFTDTPKNDRYVRLVKTWKGWVEQPRSSYNSALFKQNMEKYKPTVEMYAKKYNIPKTLLHAVITAESSYNPQAVSRAGAVGLMQLMPETARRYGVKDRKNPYENIQGGTQYLRDLMEMFEYDLTLVLAAYNAGENAVKRYGNKVPPYQETQNYVRKVKEYYAQYNKTAG